MRGDTGRGKNFVGYMKTVKWRAIGLTEGLGVSGDRSRFPFSESVSGYSIEHGLLEKGHGRGKGTL